MTSYRLYLFAVSERHADDRNGWQLQQRAQLDCTGIFDMRWAPHTPSPLLALALASGCVQLLRLADDQWQQAAAADIAQGMVLTVDWARHAARAGRVVVSTSTGHLAVLQVVPNHLAFHAWRLQRVPQLDFQGSCCWEW